LNLLKAFQNRRDTVRLSKMVRAVLPFSQKIIVNRKPICWHSKPARLPLANYQKLSFWLRKICYPIGAKDLTSPVLISFMLVQKLLDLIAQNVLFQYKIKGKVSKNHAYLPGLFPNQDLSNHNTKTEL
jgi:hypothetical protein